MSEEEAKTKACCNGAARPAENGLCIGSACMAWRWETVPGERAIIAPDDSLSSGQRVHRWQEAGDGYCGLAGEPQ